MTFTHSDNDRHVTIVVTDAKRDAICEAVLRFVTENDAFSGEYIGQSDDIAIDIIPFMCDLVDDIIKPDVVWND